MHQPPPELPELPEGADPGPRWPAWYAIAGFVVGLVGTFIAVGIVAAATGADPDEESATFTIVATLMQALVFVGTAVLFASMSAQAAGVALRAASGAVLAGRWAGPRWAWSPSTSSRSSTERSFSRTPSRRSPRAWAPTRAPSGLIVAGFMVICVAPFAEEFFFRGFFYRALRSRYSVLAAAALNGLLFGIIHFDFSGADALLILPPLATARLHLLPRLREDGIAVSASIALHAFNNSIAYGVQADDWEVSVVLGPLTLRGLLRWPRRSGGGP